MAIMNSCCCWGLKKGCYASASYSAIYFAFVFWTIWQQFAMENRQEEHDSVIMVDPLNYAPWFNKLLQCALVLSVFGLLSAIFLFVALLRDVKYLLLPWITIMFLIIVFDIICVGYLAYKKRKSPQPEVAMILTVDFFTMVLNIYVLLSVISQFQVYSDRSSSRTSHNLAEYFRFKCCRRGNDDKPGVDGECNMTENKIDLQHLKKPSIKINSESQPSSLEFQDSKNVSVTFSNDVKKDKRLRCDQVIISSETRSSELNDITSTPPGLDRNYLFPSATEV